METKFSGKMKIFHDEIDGKKIELKMIKPPTELRDGFYSNCAFCTYRIPCQETLPNPKPLKYTVELFKSIYKKEVTQDIIDLYNQLPSRYNEYCTRNALMFPDFADYIPAPGSIEEAFVEVHSMRNHDFIENMIKKNPIIRVKDFIKMGCGKWCDQYRDDFSNCNSSNSMCVMQELVRDTLETKESLPCSYGINKPISFTSHKDGSYITQDEYKKETSDLLTKVISDAENEDRKS